MKFKCCILVEISLRFVHNKPIDSKSALTQVMAWRRRVNSQLLESVIAQFIGAPIDLRR